MLKTVNPLPRLLVPVELRSDCKLFQQILELHVKMKNLWISLKSEKKSFDK